MTTFASPPPPLSGLPAEPSAAEVAPTVVPVAERVPPEPVANGERLLRVGRALLVGSAASILDLAVLSLGIRWLELGPTLARFIALVSSGLLAFFGSRSFAFRAEAGNITRQARLFVLSEAVALGLNLGVFRLFVAYAAVVPPEVGSQLANFIVFIAFTYPIRALVVFRIPALAAAPVPSTAPLAPPVDGGA